MFFFYFHNHAFTHSINPLFKSIIFVRVCLHIAYIYSYIQSHFFVGVFVIRAMNLQFEGPPKLKVYSCYTTWTSGRIENIFSHISEWTSNFQRERVHGSRRMSFDRGAVPLIYSYFWNTFSKSVPAEELILSVSSELL